MHRTLPSLVLAWTLAMALLSLVASAPAFAANVNQPVICTMVNNAPAATLTLSGGSPSPSTVPCDGVSHNIVVASGATLVATEPADGTNTRYRFAVGETSTSVVVCNTSTCPTWSLTNYYQLLQTEEMTPLVPNAWDAAYSIPLTGTLNGIQNAPLCTFTLTSGGGVSTASGCWADYDTPQNFELYFTAQTGGWWKAWSTYTFTDTTGGNTHDVLYSQVVSLSASQAGVTTTVTSTSTQLVYAQNFPSARIMAGFVTVLAFVFLVPAVLVSAFRQEGDVVVTLWLVGSFLGGLVGSMAADAASFVSGAYGYVPWGLTFFLGVASVVWLMKGGGH
jgi:hypothetical protein